MWSALVLRVLWFCVLCSDDVCARVDLLDRGHDCGGEGGETEVWSVCCACEQRVRGGRWGSAALQREKRPQQSRVSDHATSSGDGGQAEHERTPAARCEPQHDPPASFSAAVASNKTAESLKSDHGKQPHTTENIFINCYIYDSMFDRCHACSDVHEFLGLGSSVYLIDVTTKL